MADINNTYGNENEEIEIDENKLPWLIFTLKGNAYAVNSKFVNGILTPPEVTPLPEAPNIYKGLVEIRGDVFPLVEMRRLFKYQTIAEECDQFDEFMNKAEDAHRNWIDELRRCVHENRTFTLATDPTKCKFGEWFYGHMESSDLSPNVLAVLKKAENPHRMLHESAIKILDLAKNNKNGRHEDEIQRLLANTADRFVPMVIGVIEEVKATYRSAYRETAVTLSNGLDSLGLLVDEVLGVDKVEQIADDRSMSKMVDSRYFTGVGHNDKIHKEILIIDEEMLLQKAKI